MLVVQSIFELLEEFLGVHVDAPSSSSTIYQLIVAAGLVIAIVFVAWFLKTISRSVFRG